VGFQTQLKWAEQSRVLRLIPGLEQAEFVRFGMVHRNTYVNGPSVLRETWQVRQRPTLFFAGQMSGVEGYVESAASGLLAGLNAAALARGEPVLAAPRSTAIGALAYYVSHADPRHYEPSNITFGILPPLERRRDQPDSELGDPATPHGTTVNVSKGRGVDRAVHDKLARKLAIAARALADLERWMVAHGLTGAGLKTVPSRDRRSPDAIEHGPRETVVEHDRRSGAVPAPVSDR
jgi:folate-dependent tRNA-U54 methylase TrmFO/GidA